MTLYLVPTPIGNLGDITRRALAILQQVEVIFSEDTRQTIKLLNYYNIKKPLKSLYQHSPESRYQEVIQGLATGQEIAYVSERGMPGISDPGSHLVQLALKAKIKVVALPGASAVITALVASGLPTDGFVYLGFLPRPRSRIIRQLTAAARLGRTVIFYESPYRLIRTLNIMQEIFPPDTPTVIAREISKIYEEYIRQPLAEVVKHFQEKPARGELVVLFFAEKLTEVE